MAIESILPSDSGKVAFEKTDRNFEFINDKTLILSEKLEWKPNDWKTENSKPSEFGTKTETIFFATTSFGGIFPRASVVVKTTCFSSNYAKQEVFRNDTEKVIKYRLSIGGTDTWGEWQQITTNNETIVRMGELTNSHNMNNVVKPGVYRIFGTTPANFVSGQTNGYFSVLVYENNFYTVQEATNFVTGQIYKRLINSNDGAIFKDWYEVATTDKTDILCTQKPGYIITSQNSYKINNVMYINLTVKKTDSSVFSNANHYIADIPSGVRPLKSVVGFVAGLGGSNGYQSFSCILSTSGAIDVGVRDSISTELRISGVFSI